MQNKKKGHSKHAKLTKPNYGTFARNEWAFIGAPCDEIRKLVEGISELAAEPILYIDESHNHDAIVSNLSITTKKQERQEYTKGLGWNKHSNFAHYNDHDFVFVNGNHFTAEKQFVILDPRKKESVSRKLDRLTNVRAYIVTNDIEEPYDFIEQSINSETEIPKFHISDVEGIWQFVLQDYITVPIKALVLAGGKSQRMGQDKGAIDYHGKGQARYLHDMLTKQGLEVYISCRKDQSDQYEDLPQVQDKFIGLGPFGALASAFMQDPNSAWLIVPCDLPLLKSIHIEKLTSKRNPYKFATAFLNKETQFPEPLISIWEPKMYQHLLIFLAQGYSCPRKILINSEIELVEVKDQQFMMNVNTPEELAKASVLIEAR